MRGKLFVFVCLLLLMLGRGSLLTVSAEELSKTKALSDVTEYRVGWYKSWGGSYEELPGKICTLDCFEVTEDTYYLYWNDARIKVEISEYDGDGKWLGFTNHYTNGSEFRKQDNTEKVAIAFCSTQWGVSIMELLENGFALEITTSARESVMPEMVFASLEDYCDIDNWQPGNYLPETGELVINKNAVCFTKYRLVLPGIYMVHLPNSYMKMNIAEYDSNSQPVYSADYHNGEKWEKQPSTKYVAISVFTTNRSEKFMVDEYKTYIQEMGNIGLLPWEKDEVDTFCDYLTANDYVESMTVGWNLGNAFDSKGTENSRGTDKALEQELNWGNPYITEELIDYVAEWGIHTIRIPVTWYYNTWEAADGTLQINPQWIERVREVVDYAIDSGMYVILNAHHEQPIFYTGVSEEEMQGVYQDVESLWREIATHFKGYDEHLIFEAFNEVDNLERSWNYSDTAAQQMNHMNQIFVDTVRKTGGNNVTRLLCVPTLLDGYDSTFLEAFELPKDVVEQRLLIQVHTYPTLFSQSIEPFFERMERFSNDIGAPVIIGEWGTTKSYPIPELRESHAANFIARGAMHGIKSIWWDNGSDYRIIDRKDISKSDIDMMQAIMNGVAGEQYISEQAYCLDEDSFIYKMPNTTTGELEDKYWGTCTTDESGNGMCIPEGSQYCSVNVVRKKEADDIWLQRILFYEENGAYIGGREIRKVDIIMEIPENARYMRVSINSPYRHITWEEYAGYLINCDLQLQICYE